MALMRCDGFLLSARRLISGMKFVDTHLLSKLFATFFKFSAAAMRIWYTESRIQSIHCPHSFCLNKSGPSFAAKIGMCLRIASRILHFLSRASSSIAGIRDCDNSSIPMTSFTASSLEMTFRRTSGSSSLSNWRNWGSRNSSATSFGAHLARAMITEAKAARVYWQSSLASASIGFMSFSVVNFFPISAPTPATFWAAAVRTSASPSCRSWT
mmetsp:Transcript_35119/g.65069  ORF Transcript_35119/g.65069 Transcript_35119/m.65069 type:complete len:212 (+) Transcript_35119:491-1126(+)